MTTPHPLPSTAKAGEGAEHRSPDLRAANNGSPDDGWTFRAPRWGDLVVCPYCDPDTFTCDHCGGERRLYASEVLQ